MYLRIDDAGWFAAEGSFQKIHSRFTVFHRYQSLIRAERAAVFIFFCQIEVCCCLYACQRQFYFDHPLHLVQEFYRADFLTPRQDLHTGMGQIPVPAVVSALHMENVCRGDADPKQNSFFHQRRQVDGLRILSDDTSQIRHAVRSFFKLFHHFFIFSGNVARWLASPVEITIRFLRGIRFDITCSSEAAYFMDQFRPLRARHAERNDFFRSDLDLSMAIEAYAAVTANAKGGDLRCLYTGKPSAYIGALSADLHRSA